MSEEDYNLKVAGMTCSEAENFYRMVKKNNRVLREKRGRVALPFFVLHLPEKQSYFRYFYVARDNLLTDKNRRKEQK
jgi:hypothetical protein